MKHLSDLIGEVIVDYGVNEFGKLVITTEGGINIVVDANTTRVVDVEDIENYDAVECNKWVAMGNIPVFQHKEVIFANNSNLSYQDQLENLNTDFPNVEWKQVDYQIYDVELQFWLPTHLVDELEGKLLDLIVEVHQFVTNERDIELVTDEYYAHIAETTNYRCMMYDNRLVDFIYND